jgi:hypothetical protein
MQRRRWVCLGAAMTNSFASSSSSVTSSGSGQMRPAAAKRLSISRTVDGATPRRRAISRVDRPPTNFNLRTSRTWRMAVLSAGIGSSFGSQRSGPERARRGTHSEEQIPRYGQQRVSGFKSEWWAASVRNGGRLRAGIGWAASFRNGGRLQVGTGGDIVRNPQRRCLRRTQRRLSSHAA